MHILLSNWEAKKETAMTVGSLCGDSGHKTQCHKMSSRGGPKMSRGGLERSRGGPERSRRAGPPRARPYFNPCKDTYRLFNSSVSQWHVQSANFPNNFRRKSLRLLNSAHSRFKSMSSSNSWCASHTASAFRRFCVIVVHSHVFRRLSAEKLLSAAQLDTGATVNSTIKTN